MSVRRMARPFAVRWCSRVLMGARTRRDHPTPENVETRKTTSGVAHAAMIGTMIGIHGVTPPATTVPRGNAGSLAKSAVMIAVTSGGTIDFKSGVSPAKSVVTTERNVTTSGALTAENNPRTNADENNTGTIADIVHGVCLKESIVTAVSFGMTPDLAAAKDDTIGAHAPTNEDSIRGIEIGAGRIRASKTGTTMRSAVFDPLMRG